MGENRMTILRKLTYWASLLLIFALPWEDSISVPGLGSLARLMGFAVAGLWMVTVILEGRFRKPNLFHVLVLLFFLWNFVSLFWSSDIPDSIQRIQTYSQIFLLLLIYWDVYRKPAHLMAGLQAYIFGAYVLIGSTVYNYLANHVAVQYEGRYSATGINANDVALILILGLPIGLPIAMQLLFVVQQNITGTLLRIADILYIPLCIFAIFLTGSRTSLIAVVPFVVFIIATQRIKLERKIFIFALLLFSILALIPFVPQSLINRISTVGSSISQADMGGRVTMWRKSITVLAQYPVVGIGAGAVDRMIGGAVHNTLISVTTETGVVGLFFFLAILGLVVYDVVRLPRQTSGLWLAIFTTWAIGAFSLSWEFRKLTWIILNFMVIESSLGRDALALQEAANASEKRRQSTKDSPLISQPEVTGPG